MEIFLLLTFLHFFALPFPTYVTAVPSQTSSSYINIELRQEVDAPEAVRRWIEWSPLINQADMISSDWKAWATTDLCLFLRQSGAQASLDPDAYVRGSVASLEYERHTLVELSFYPRLRNYRISDFFAVIRRGVRKLRQSNLQVPFHDYRRYMIAVASGLGMMQALQAGYPVENVNEENFVAILREHHPDFTHEQIPKAGSPNNLGFIISYQRITSR